MEDKNKIIFVVVIAVLIIGIFYYNQKWQDAEKSFGYCADAPLEETIAFKYCFGELEIIKALGGLQEIKDLEELAQKWESFEESRGAENFENWERCIQEAKEDPIGTLRKMGFEEINSE